MAKQQARDISKILTIGSREPQESSQTHWCFVGVHSWLCVQDRLQSISPSDERRVPDKAGGGMGTEIMQYRVASCLDKHPLGVLWEPPRARIPFCPSPGVRNCRNARRGAAPSSPKQRRKKPQNSQTLVSGAEVRVNR